MQNIFFKTEVILPVVYEGEHVGTYRPDFIIDDKVLIELKALPICQIKQNDNYLIICMGLSINLVYCELW
ncbi:hypothetical protein A2164_01690 [Candidatus Curtissbacteria bacterium RBG_13_35_7]|uniref:GxxExxY protein n=1 Tax=Candidatus Curtissbacteria bacterium RBG_13_35_7 TaxID=1797705 RepID=A0A1F5G021_9BACT|nr:MAG: hypothetical protein A2164_01690 [Candidatus Curtissbacteria bacterium RBG_13_35_7]